MADDLMEEEKAEAPAQEQPEAPAPDAAEDEGPAERPQSNASQQAAMKLIAAAGRIVYKKEVTALILKMIQKAPRPEAGIAQAVLMVMKQVKDAAKGVPPQVIDKLAKPVTMMVMEVAVAAGVIEDDPGMVKTIVGLIQQAIGQVQAGPKKGPIVPNPGPAQPAPQGMVAGQMGG